MNVHSPKDVVLAWEYDSMIIEVLTGIVCTPRGWGEIYCRTTSRFRRTFKYKQYAIVPKSTYEEIVQNSYAESIPEDTLSKILSTGTLPIMEEVLE